MLLERSAAIGLAGRQRDHLRRHVQAAQLLLELGGRAGQHREGPPVDRDDLLGLEEPAGAGGLVGVHGVEVADGHERELWFVQLRQELHVREQPGVSRVIEGESPGQLHHVAAGRAAVEDLVPVGDTARVVGSGHGDAHAEHVLAAADVHRRRVFHAFAREPLAGLEVGDDKLGLVRACQLEGVADMIVVRMRDEHGVDGLDIPPDLVGARWIVHHPGVDEDDLAGVGPKLHSRMPKERELYH